MTAISIERPTCDQCGGYVIRGRVCENCRSATLVGILRELVNYYGTAPFHDEGECANEPNCLFHKARAALAALEA